MLTTLADYHGPPLVLAEATTIALLIVGVVLAASAALLLKPKQQDPVQDNNPTTITLRGAWLPYIIGRRLTGPIFAWVGNRTSREEGSGGKGGSPSSKQTVYYEEGLHIIGLGPLTKLHFIKRNKKIIFTGPITPDDTPSGSTLQTTDGSTFKIFWGEEFGPIDTWLGDESRLGAMSRWPYHAHIDWMPFKCGTSAVWGEVEYDLEGTCVGTELPGSACHFDAQDTTANDSGVNGAHIIYQLATGRYPHGVSFPTANVDFGLLKDTGVLVEAERLPMNLLLQDGPTAASVIADVLMDLGVMMPQIGKKLAFVPVRAPTGDVPELDDRMVIAPNPEEEFNTDSAFDRVVFNYKDNTHAWTDADVVLDDDASARYFQTKATRKINLPTVTDAVTATKVAERRRLEDFTQGNKVTLRVNRTARRLWPGAVFDYSPLGRMIVGAVKATSNAADVAVEATVDQYSLNPTGWNPGLPPGTDGGGGNGIADLAFRAIEVPHEIAGSVLSIAVLRVRGSPVAGSAAIWASTTGTSYIQVGTQGAWCIGGTLIDDLEPGGNTILESGPRIEALNADISAVLDLTGDRPSWFGGRQMCLIDDELFYLRSVTAVSGGYRLNGLIRARLGTSRARHNAVSRPTAYIFTSDMLRQFTNLAWGRGTNLRVKSQPAGVSLDSVLPNLLTLKASALGPPPTDNGKPFTWGSGEDIEFEWTYRRRRGTGAGAGEGPAGSAMGATPDPEGVFKVEIINFTTNAVVRTETTPTPDFTYTETMRLADFVSEPALLSIRVTNILNSYGAYSQTWTLRRV